MGMIQYGITDLCNGNCDFCLIRGNPVEGEVELINEVYRTINNIKYLASKGLFNTTYKDGVSIIGGELYFWTNPEYHKAMNLLIDTISEYVILPSEDRNRVRLSTVSNGNYDPNILLFPLIDRFISKTSIRNVDMNFSFDLDWRFKTEEQKQRVLKTINAFHDRYNYQCGVQMILTQKLIDRILYEKWRPQKFIDEYLPGNQLALLYPHPIHRGNGNSGEHNLPGFFFTRDSFLKTMMILREEEPTVFEAFVCSTRNSAIFKQTGLYEKGNSISDEDAIHQMPKYSDGKEITNYNCRRSHSILYKCYSDSDECMLCDLEELV